MKKNAVELLQTRDLLLKKKRILNLRAYKEGSASALAVHNGRDLHPNPMLFSQHIWLSYYKIYV